MVLYRVIWYTAVNGKDFQHASGLLTEDRAIAEADALAEAVGLFAAKDIIIIPVCIIEQKGKNCHERNY